MDFELSHIEELIQEVEIDAPPTGDPWLDARYQEDVPIIGHVNPYYRLFYRIAQLYRPRFTVELGSYRGVAAAHIAAGHPEGIVVTIDIHKDDKIAQQKTREVHEHYDNLFYVNAWTWDAAPVIKHHLELAGIGIDLLYIDAWHEYKYADRERKIYFPQLSDSALVIADDIFDAMGATVDMVRFWTEMKGEKFLYSGPLHGRIPMGFLKYEKANYETD